MPMSSRPSSQIDVDRVSMSDNVSVRSGSTTTSGHIRKFGPAVGRPGQAREAREAVRFSLNTQPTRDQLISLPVDYENFISKNRTSLENDPQRDILLFPRDDITECQLQREDRTCVSSVSPSDVHNSKWLLTQECLKNYSAEYRVLSFNYSKFSGDYTKISENCLEQLSELTYESDLIEEDQTDCSQYPSSSSESLVIKSGYLLQLNEGPSLRSGKKRHCTFRRQPGGRIQLEMSKDQGAGTTVIKYGVNGVKKANKKSKSVLEVTLEPNSTGKQKDNILLAVENEKELEVWIGALNDVLEAPLKEETQSTGSGAAETSSMGSQESYTSEFNWKGTAAGKSLKPPSVDRRDLFALYPDLEPLPYVQESCLLQNQVDLAVPKETQAVPFLVECKHLRIKVPVAPAHAGDAKDQQIEPFFLRLYLFDARSGERISEEFHLDPNPESVQSMLPSSHNQNTDNNDNLDNVKRNSQLRNKVKGRKALFTVPQPHPDIYLVARVERILQMPALDVYQKLDPKVTHKHQKSLTAALSRLSHYRMTFGWTARPVFQELLGTTKEELPLYRCDSDHSSDVDLSKFLQDLARPEKAAKLQTFSGTSVYLHIDLSIRPDELLNRITPNYLPVKPFLEESCESLIHEIMTFSGSQETNVRPHTSAINLLYIYPLSLRYDSQRCFAKARNIVCSIQLKDKDSVDASPLKLIYNRGRTDFCFTNCDLCCVGHHQPSPSFSEEIKLELPLNLTEKHHILFSFGHVAVTSAVSSKSGQTSQSVETIAGFAWIPLVKKDRLNLENQFQEFNLPVAVDLPNGYLSCQSLGLGKGHSGPDIRWVEGGRSLFKVKIRLVSSVMTAETKLQKFFQSVQRLDRTGLLSDAFDDDSTKADENGDDKTLTDENEILAATNDCGQTALGLLSVPSDRLIPFLPVVLNQLLTFLPLATTEEAALSAFKTLVGVVDSAALSGQNGSLRRFVYLQFQSPNGGVHEALCKYWPQLLRPAHAEPETTAALMRRSWFFTDVTIKSMAQWLLIGEKHKLPRAERYPAELLFRIEAFVQTLVPLIVAKHRDLRKECKLANTSLAYFLRGCLNLTDRGMILRLVYFYMDKMSKGDSKLLRELKLEFLQIISQHEHWLPLCLPVLCTQNALVRKVSVSGEKVQERKPSMQQPGSGFLQRILSAVFGTNKTSSVGSRNADPELGDELRLTPGYCERHFLSGLLLQELVASLRDPKDVRHYAVEILRNLLAKHSADPRYVDRGSQQRISTLYLPLLPILLEYSDELQAVVIGNIADNSSKRVSLPMVQAIGRTSFVESTPSPEPRKRTTAEHGRSASGSAIFAEKLDAQEVKDLLLCALFVMRNSSEKLLAAIWQQSSTSQLIDFVGLLELALDLFHYQGRKVTLRKTASKLRASRRTLLLPSSSNQPLNDESELEVSPFSVLQEANLAQEVALSVLDCLAVFCRQLKDRLDAKLTENEQLLFQVNQVYLSLLADHWSEQVRLHTLAANLSFVKQFHVSFFYGSLTLLSCLSRRLLEQLSSRLLTVQRSAAALLQILLRSSYECSGKGPTLGRLGAQIGVALAHLLGEGKQLADSAPFHRGLAFLENLASTSKKTSQFDQLVMDLVKQLRGILVATSALKEAEKDQYRLAELHLRLADSYRGSANLRQAWLESLATLHEKHQAHSEAALCHLHVAALMSRELNTKGLGCGDWRLMAAISENIAVEEGSKANSIEIQEAGYTVDNFCVRIEAVANLLIKAERHEALGPLYRLVLPIYEQKRDYQKLSDAYGSLQRAYSKALTLHATGRRALASYFRVVFYGQFHFPEEHGREWIYKEPGLTSLAQAADQLRSQSMITLGHNRVQLLASDTQQSQLSNLNEDTAYIQITHVEPVIDVAANVDDDFELHTNVRKLRFETKLIENEASGGNLNDVTRCGMKRMFLTTSRSFPFVLRRLPVVSRSEQVLTPLKVAIEAIQTKCNQLRRTLDARPAVDLKRLQLQLQGAVQTTVNAGPLVYAQAFTTEKQISRYGNEELEKLKDVFRTLCKVSAESLEVNSLMIQSDQIPYQQMLEESFEVLVTKLNEVFGEELLTPKADTKLTQNGIENDMKKHLSTHIFDSISAVNDY